MEKIEVEGIRALKKLRGQNLKVVIGEAYTRLNSSRKYGSLTVNLFYHLRELNKKSLSIEKTIEWMNEEKECEGSAANNWIWCFTLVKIA